MALLDFKRDTVRILFQNTNGMYKNIETSQEAQVVKNPPANAEDIRDRFDSWVRKIRWRKAWQPAPVFLSGQSHSGAW